LFATVSVLVLVHNQKTKTPFFMAFQKGVVKLKGEIGDLSFYKTKDGYLAKEKTEISAARIKNDPSFARTRENGEEFLRANKAGKVLRESMKVLTAGIADGRMTARLGKLMSAVVKSDPVNDRGKRHVLAGDLGMINKFQFNVGIPLTQAFSPLYTTTFNRVTGAATVTIQPFEPATLIGAPNEASHYSLLLCVAACNFTEETYVNKLFRTAELPTKNVQTVTLPPLVANITAANTNPVFVALGITFWQEVNGKYYSLQSGNNNAAGVVFVDNPD
jgi:hypothetical protein